jgi:hypothetical protein
MEPAWDGWRSDYSRKLGAPLGVAVVKNGVMARRFASGTTVVLDTTKPDATGCVHWSDGNVTGTPRACRAPLPDWLPAIPTTPSEAKFND